MCMDRLSYCMSRVIFREMIYLIGVKHNIRKVTVLSKKNQHFALWGSNPSTPSASVTDYARKAPAMRSVNPNAASGSIWLIQNDAKNQLKND